MPEYGLAGGTSATPYPPSPAYAAPYVAGGQIKTPYPPESSPTWMKTLQATFEQALSLCDRVNGVTSRFMGPSIDPVEAKQSPTSCGGVLGDVEQGAQLLWGRINTALGSIDRLAKQLP